MEKIVAIFVAIFPMEKIVELIFKFFGNHEWQCQTSNQKEEKIVTIFATIFVTILRKTRGKNSINIRYFFHGKNKQKNSEGRLLFFHDYNSNIFLAILLQKSSDYLCYFVATFSMKKTMTFGYSHAFFKMERIVIFNAIFTTIFP